MERLEKVLKTVREDSDFGSSKDFIEDGLLDSFDIVTLVEEIEEEYDIELNGSDIIPENFKNMESILALINMRKEDA